MVSPKGQNITRIFKNAFLWNPSTHFHIKKKKKKLKWLFLRSQNLDNQSEKKKKKYQIKMMQYPDENSANLITNSGGN